MQVGVVKTCGRTARTLLAAAMIVAIGGTAAGDGWMTGTTGKGSARWTVQGDKLVYRGGGDFGWAVTGPAFANGFVETRMRPVGGTKDQAGGVIWRWRDANNYYIARANALENNVVAYKVVNGRRTDLKPVGTGASAYGVKATVPARTWHALRVDFSGAEFTVRFDRDVATFRVRDESLTEAGRVGVWSKADSETEFEEFRFQERR